MTAEQIKALFCSYNGIDEDDWNFEVVNSFDSILSLPYNIREEKYKLFYSTYQFSLSCHSAFEFFQVSQDKKWFYPYITVVLCCFDPTKDISDWGGLRYHPLVYPEFDFFKKDDAEELYKASEMVEHYEELVWERIGRQPDINRKHLMKVLREGVRLYGISYLKKILQHYVYNFSSRRNINLFAPHILLSVLRDKTLAYDYEFYKAKKLLAIEEYQTRVKELCMFALPDKEFQYRELVDAAVMYKLINMWIYPSDKRIKPRSKLNNIALIMSQGYKYTYMYVTLVKQLEPVGMNMIRYLPEGLGLMLARHYGSYHTMFNV